MIKPLVRDITLPFNYAARPYQLPFWEAMKSGKKRAVLVWHRRAGKEKTCWNYLITQACRRVGIYYYFFPHFSQGRKILWDGADKDGFRLLDHIPKELIKGNPNSTEMKLRLQNDSLIQIIGTNNIDSIVGTNPIGCVFTEYSLQDPAAWTLIRPILRENGGWAVFNFTPRGANHAKDLYDMAEINDDWFCQLLTVEDTGVLTVADMEKERKEGMSEDMIQQEYYCSFTLGVEGSYYAKYLQEAKDEGRVGNIPWDRQKRVYTAWDIGYGDSTSIVFYQLCGQEIHIIDYYENNGEGLSHYAKVLSDKPYIYEDHYAPHDIDSHSFSSGLSAREVGLGLGVKFIPLRTLKISLEDGIEAVRGIFPRLWIDEVKCARLIKCVENYRKEYNESLMTYRMRPVHDWSSHGCFVGETAISTIRGERAIKDIKVGDFVLTPNGYRKVLKTFVYDAHELLEVHTTSSKFQCTPNHKIFAGKGLVYADTLRYNDIVYSQRSRGLCQKKFGSSLGMQDLGFRENFLLVMMNHKSSSMDTGTGGMDFTLEGEQQLTTPIALFKEQFGLSTEEKSPQNGMFIIKIETQKTILSKILRLFHPRNIQDFTLTNLVAKKNHVSVFTKLWNMLKLGIKAKRDWCGIGSMQKTPCLENFACRKFVNCATENMRARPIIKNFAAMRARLNTGIGLEKMKLKDNVKFADPPLNPTNTLLSERVVKIVPVSLPITQKVYDFEVEGDHCYYANGILVSNSDALRYMAIAIKTYVDSSKGGIDDSKSREMYEKFNPLFK